MSDGKEKKETGECEGIRHSRETDKEIKQIRESIATMCTNSEVNAANLTNLAESFKGLAKANSLTHYKLFGRTEKLKVAMGKAETTHEEHVKHGTQEGANKHNRATFLVSLVAIGISVAAVVMLAIQAGLFN